MPKELRTTLAIISVAAIFIFVAVATMIVFLIFLPKPILPSNTHSLKPSLQLTSNEVPESWGRDWSSYSYDMIGTGDKTSAIKYECQPGENAPVYTLLHSIAAYENEDIANKNFDVIITSLRLLVNTWEEEPQLDRQEHASKHTVFCVGSADTRTCHAVAQYEAEISLLSVQMVPACVKESEFMNMLKTIDANSQVN